jgi:hypothetical protein
MRLRKSERPEKRQEQLLRMTQDEKLDEALKETFPASDAFYLAPDNAVRSSEPEGGWPPPSGR